MKLKITDSELEKFIFETNTIEGILVTDEALKKETAAMQSFLYDWTKVKLVDLIMLLGVAQPGAVLRTEPEQLVSVGGFIPPAPGQHIVYKLDDILHQINDQGASPWHTHVKFEKLHPFTDGNGRLGRAIWLYMMLTQSRTQYKLGFLHAFYYQTLENQ